MRASRRTIRVGGAAALAALAGCGVELEHGLDERQANEAVAALEGAGLAAEKAPDDGAERWMVVVSHGDATQAFRVLEARGLPRRAHEGVGEAFADKGLLPSATAERARLQASIAADLERTLERLPGVTSARVHLALPDEDALHAPAAYARPTASVLLRGRLPLPTAESEVRRLVAGAVQGLQTADVSVVAASDEVAGAVELAPLGPLRVARGSRGLLLGLASAALGLLLALSVALAVLGTRLAALRRRLGEK